MLKFNEYLFNVKQAMNFKLNDKNKICSLYASEDPDGLLVRRLVIISLSVLFDVQGILMFINEKFAFLFSTKQYHYMSS